MPAVNRLILTVLIGLTSACVPQYRPPTIEQPHAILKLRRIYAQSAGDLLSEHLLVEGSDAYRATVPAGRAKAPRTDSILVHPRAAHFLVTSQFFHEETRAEDESKWVDVPYDDVEMYDCGTEDNHQTCTRMVTKSRSELQHETVYRTVTVTDASCSREVVLGPAAGDVYLLQFDFLQSGVCRLSCFQQISERNGSFTMRSVQRPSGQKSQP
jgi:hypothetical protein